jgi:hypothetical protein
MGEIKKNYAQDFADFSRLANLYENKAETSLANYIHEVQQMIGGGFIRFTNNTGFPCFVNTIIDTYENIYGIKAVGGENDREFLIYTDDQPYDEMETNEDGWFRWRDYGELSMDDVYYYVAQLAKTLNI